MVVTAVLSDPQAAQGHRYGINSLASSPGNGCASLFSAGRDGTVRCWDTSAEGVAAVGSMDEHTDWVNDLACLQDGLFASCSSDCTVKLWSPPQPTQPAPECETLRHHTDYVKALAYCSERRLLASAGCDCTVLLWDVEGRTLYSSSGQEGHTDSVYCLAANSAGTLIASGSVDTDVRLWDPRSPDSELRLPGHTDVVRSLLLTADGSRVVSCGSDGSVRVWHIGERRCEATWTSHEESVYSLAFDESGAHVLSGDRAGAVRLTNLSNGSSRPLCSAVAAVQRLHVESAGGAPRPRLWVATTASNLACWQLPHTLSTLSTDGHAVLGSPELDIPGAAGIRRFETVPSRLRVLTEDSEGDAALWDVCTGEICERYQKVPGEAKGPYDKVRRAAGVELAARQRACSACGLQRTRGCGGPQWILTRVASAYLTSAAAP